LIGAAVLLGAVPAGAQVPPGALVGVFIGFVLPDEYCPACFRSCKCSSDRPGEAGPGHVGNPRRAGDGHRAAVASGEQWEIASLDRLHVTVAPARGPNVRLAVRFRF
jgi:hypothetical protein